MWFCFSIARLFGKDRRILNYLSIGVLSLGLVGQGLFSRKEDLGGIPSGMVFKPAAFRRIGSSKIALVLVPSRQRHLSESLSLRQAKDWWILRKPVHDRSIHEARNQRELSNSYPNLLWS